MNSATVLVSRLTVLTECDGGRVWPNCGAECVKDPAVTKGQIVFACASRNVYVQLTAQFGITAKRITDHFPQFHMPL